MLQVYRLTEHFPQKEIYGFTSQFRRAAISVPANTAERYEKLGRLDRIRFLNIAHGSLEECHYYLILARDLGYGEVMPLQSLLEETARLLQE